ncbi:MAG: glycogen debranching protein [Flavobacteria bacterium RIFCSPLOWO2_12_FULL_35_11]|nr:MAG: glycogen debranching protein [Flavobacteria bacterium RIFCSPLOWO2_12_FULL_35_11]
MVSFKNNFWIIVLLVAVTGCVTKSEKSNKNILYKSGAFTVYTDSVVQGENKAVVISNKKITSNYKSTSTKNYSNLVSFKFTINEKDIELPSGNDHHVLIENGVNESPIIVFGEADKNLPIDKGEKLNPNYQYTFKVDMSPVLDAFEKKGYYEAYDKSRIAKQDFKGFYIAGGSKPLTWDFSNLEENNLELFDKDGDGIYEIILLLNPYDSTKKESKTWELSQDISKKPSYSSDQPIVDVLYNLSSEEALLAIEPDSTFRTGAKWAGVWTRDISYSIVLAFAYLEPEVAKISLMKKVKRNRIIQDTGSGGAWPVSSDRTTWALAAWEVYKTTGDKNWLKKSYEIIKNSVDDDYKVIRSKETGMYSGESSFLDWREQTYPKWMSNMDIYVSQNLGTNVVHYQTHIILSKMAKLLGEPEEKYEAIAAIIKKGINEQLWMEDKGYYAQYLYGRHHLIASKKYEALGEALAVIFDVANETQSQSIIEKSPLTEFGATCIYPQIPNIPPYHNDGIWPFVQSYWNIAAAKVGNEKVLNHGLASIYRAAGLYLSNYENMVANTGDFEGTEINSHRMLWSMAGNLAMVYRVFLGMEFKEDGILFNPAIPKGYGGNKSLKNFKYRKAILNIEVEGFGNKIASIYLDGTNLVNAKIPSTIEGEHQIKIKMMNNDFSSGEINLVKNKYSLGNPIVKLLDNTLSWNPIKGAASYNIYENGKVIKTIKSTSYPIGNNLSNEYMVSAVDSDKFESFVSEPILISEKTAINFELENFMPKANLGYVNYSGKGYVELSNITDNKITFLIDIPETGEYYLDFRYSNGSGPWNTDNKCALRSLYLNKDYVGTIVLPQRGLNEWSDWGYTNSHKVHLNKGKNELKLTLENWNINMNVEINTAMLDFLRVQKITNRSEGI